MSDDVTMSLRSSSISSFGAFHFSVVNTPIDALTFWPRANKTVRKPGWGFSFHIRHNDLLRLLLLRHWLVPEQKVEAAQKGTGNGYDSRQEQQGTKSGAD